MTAVIGDHSAVLTLVMKHRLTCFTCSTGETGKLVSAQPFVNVNWAKGVDTGRSGPPTR